MKCDCRIVPIAQSKGKKPNYIIVSIPNDDGVYFYYYTIHRKTVNKNVDIGIWNIKYKKDEATKCK